jgi:hypothetical protein
MEERVELCTPCLGRVEAMAWKGLQDGVSKTTVGEPEYYLPSISLCSYTKPLSTDGLPANGQPQASRFQVPIA